MIDPLPKEVSEPGGSHFEIENLDKLQNPPVPETVEEARKRMKSDAESDQE